MPDRRRVRRPVSSGQRIVWCVGLGLLGAAASARWLPWQAVDLIGWDVATAVFLVVAWRSIAWLDAAATERWAIREDPSIPLSELIVLSAAVACLGGVGMALVKAGQISGGLKAGLIVISVVSVITAWGTVHTTFTLRYARLYYTGRNGGVDFNDRANPTYVDFAYLAFTIGMTFQVSDTDLTSASIRHLALRHALLSYLFGAVIIVASLLH
jgi:uncharacterized membrane protein